MALTTSRTCDYCGIEMEKGHPDDMSHMSNSSTQTEIQLTLKIKGKGPHKSDILKKVKANVIAYTGDDCCQNCLKLSISDYGKQIEQTT